MSLVKSAPVRPCARIKFASVHERRNWHPRQSCSGNNVFPTPRRKINYCSWKIAKIASVVGKCMASALYSAVMSVGLLADPVYTCCFEKASRKIPYDKKTQLFVDGSGAFSLSSRNYEITCLEKPSQHGWKPLLFEECINIDYFMSNFRRKHGINNETTIKWVQQSCSAARPFLWIFTVSCFVSYKK